MPTVLAVAKLAHTSLLERDSDQNSFVFDSEHADALALANALEAYEGSTGLVQSFYTDTPAGSTTSLNVWLGNCFDRGSNKCQIEYYDISAHLDGSAHGSPILTTQWTLGGAPLSATDLPSEAAVVATIHDVFWGASAVEAGTTRPKSRHAGRLYIGPFCTTAVAMVGNEARVLSNLTDLIARNCRDLIAHAAGIGTATSWSHWSRTLAATFAVVGGHVDNAFDTQRRRGVAATTSELWSGVTPV
jgi:hypothetical protein